jgi:glycosyltransferase involved in cell wall biosynthesis
VSIVVPVRDGAAVLDHCLDALAGQEDAPPSEVIVVDNGSRDATAELANQHPIVDRVVVELRPGSYAARNAGIAEAKGAVLAFTDADCRPEGRWLAEGIAALDKGDLVGGDVIPCGSPSPTIWERYDRAQYLRQGDSVAKEGFAATANLFVAARVIERIGPFDAGLRSGGDFDLCKRAAASGFRLVHAPAARVHHLPRSTAAGTWALHRRLGAGWADLALRGERPTAWRDPAMWPALGVVTELAAQQGPRLRRRHLLLPHIVAITGRWLGRLTRRP